MVEDFWPTLHQDPYALARLKKSIKLCEIGPLHSVLDVGCHQEEARNFIPASCDYLGLDHIKGDNFDGGFSLHRKFDRILCLEVLEHLNNPLSTIESICNHLAPEGVLVVSLPNEATLFHRIRCLLGIVDQECFSSQGKHLHLPSLKQSREFLRSVSGLQIMAEEYYISGSAVGSRQAWVGKILSLTPDSILCLLAQKIPSLFSRGFIFVCKIRPSLATPRTIIG